MLVVEVHRVDEAPIDVELELAVRIVADPDRARVEIAAQVIEGGLGEAVSPVDAVDHLQPAAPLGLLTARLEPSHEGARLFGEADAEEGVECEARVADPGVAVVPVAAAPDALGQARGGGGDEGARGLEGQELEN